MTYRLFRAVCVTRVIFLAASIYLIIYLLTETTLYATSLIVGVAIVLQIMSLIHYIEETNRGLTRFLLSIKYSDFSQSFSRSAKGKSFEELNEAFSSVIAEFQKARTEKEEQYRYLQTVVQHIGLGIMSYDKDGNVDLINNAARRLFGLPSLRNISNLKAVSEKLAKTLHELRSGDKALVKIELPTETLRLSIYATEFRLHNQTMRLVSMQNIESELSEQEMEAWQKLIRVLTHEIMNSVTPIASLASTIDDIVKRSGTESAESELSEDARNDIQDAATTIEKRSRGLLRFVAAYRSLARIPKPNIQLVSVSDLLRRVGQLMAEQSESHSIDLKIKIESPNIQLRADPELIEQVLINLVLNSIHALADKQNPSIELRSGLDSRGRAVITVADNGPGIDSEVIDKIFTPFFTTRKDGSGIGLSISRQVMRLHKGGISVKSTPGNETAFTLRF
ncbi:MAG: ATP-binding protein [candidate division Zixibacteria bacterium]|nr:ATP-binding protein [candidate division Zixibacteria bacterium]MBU1470138.1 ATP-binding protein [candidate division Zixibacteria bacterium]MBU2626019.1 ATP-binding protein [candidate division Zixibacteria bacterium]